MLVSSGQSIPKVPSPRFTFDEDDAAGFVSNTSPWLHEHFHVMFFAHSRCFISNLTALCAPHYDKFDIAPLP